MRLTRIGPMRSSPNFDYIFSVGCLQILGPTVGIHMHT